MANPTYGSWHTSATPDDDVRTIFVSGFPADTKERELQNLLRWWPGYEACQLTIKADAPLGFALFSTPAMAIAARDALQGLVFDLETNSTLRAEMAKKNLFVKKGVVPPSTSPAASPAYDSNKRMRGAEYPGPAYGQPPVAGYISASVLEPPPPGPLYASYAYAVPSSPAPQRSQSAVHLSPHYQVSSPSPSPYSYSSTPRRGGGGGGSQPDNPPCNTLFVGNLGEGALEGELHGIFGAMPGYRQCKLVRQAHGTVCFVEFEDIETATAAHSAAQGMTLRSGGPGPMRVQFSKNPWGRKRDGSFHPGSAAAEASGGAPGDGDGKTNGTALSAPGEPV